MMKSKPVTAQERRWVLIFALGVILLTSLPYALAFIRDSQGFTGFLIGVEDGNSYIAKMLNGASGDWLFRSPYGVSNQQGALLYTPYLILGKLLGAAAPHALFVLLFHLFRALSIIALCWACYDFIAFFAARIQLRRLGLALATLGSGLGWLLLLLGKSDWWGSLPLDFYSPETFGYLAVFGLPHLVLARALLLWGFLHYLREPKNDRRPWLISLLWLSLALTHLITAGLGLLLIGLHLVVLFVLQRQAKKDKVNLRPRVIYALWAAVGVGPVFLFNGFVFWRDAYLRSWAAQNQILSPNPLHYLFAYGWLLPFAYFGLRSLLKERTVGSFAASWLVALPFMLYLPFGLQRRLAEGAWVLLVVLALHYFDQGNWTKSKHKLWFFVLALPSTLILLLGSLQAAMHPTPPVFLPAPEIAVFKELGQIANPGEVVLAAYQTSNALPAWAPLRMVIGHAVETIHIDSLLNRVENFYELNTPDEARLDFLENNDVSYVIRGPVEVALGKWDLKEADFLKLILKVGEYEVFQVIQP